MIKEGTRVSGNHDEPSPAGEGLTIYDVFFVHQ